MNSISALTQRGATDVNHSDAFSARWQDKGAKTNVTATANNNSNLALKNHKRQYTAHALIN